MVPVETKIPFKQSDIIDGHQQITGGICQKDYHHYKNAQLFFQTLFVPQKSLPQKFPMPTWSHSPTASLQGLGIDTSQLQLPWLNYFEASQVSQNYRKQPSPHTKTPSHKPKSPLCGVEKIKKTPPTWSTCFFHGVLFRFVWPRLEKTKDQGSYLQVVHLQSSKPRIQSDIIHKDLGSRVGSGALCRFAMKA